MKLRPWTEWRTRTGDWIVGIQVRVGFDSLARWFGRRRKSRRDNAHHSRPANPDPDHKTDERLR